MQKNKLVIVGAGGHGRSVADAAMLGGMWQEIVFADDAFAQQKTSARWPIISDTAHLSSVVQAGDSAIVAIGNQPVRMRLFQQLTDLKATLVTVTHPGAWVSVDAAIGAGTAIMAGVVVGTQATVGRGSIINANATVDHDVILGEFAHLGVGVSLAGGVVVGDRAWLQAGVSAGYHVKVLPDSVVAPGTALCFE